MKSNHSRAYVLLILLLDIVFNNIMYINDPIYFQVLIRTQLQVQLW